MNDVQNGVRIHTGCSSSSELAPEKVVIRKASRITIYGLALCNLSPFPLTRKPKNTLQETMSVSGGQIVDDDGHGEGLYDDRCHQVGY